MCRLLLAVPLAVYARLWRCCHKLLHATRTPVGSLTSQANSNSNTSPMCPAALLHFAEPQNGTMNQRVAA